MIAMADESHKGTPAPFGLGKLPPSRSRRLSQPEIDPQPLTRRSDMPPEQRDWLEGLLGELKSGQDATLKELAAERGRDLAWRAEIEERLENVERIVRLWEGVVLEVRELRIEQRTLVTTVLHNAQDDVVTARELGNLKAELARSAAASGSAAGTIAGDAAGKSAGRKWGGTAIVVAVCSLAVAVVNQCGPILTKTDGAAPPAASH